MVNLDKHQYFTPAVVGRPNTLAAMTTADGFDYYRGVPAALVLLLLSFREVRGRGDPQVRLEAPWSADAPPAGHASGGDDAAGVHTGGCKGMSSVRGRYCVCQNAESWCKLQQVECKTPE